MKGTFVAFLRGINVGGNTRVPMKRLAELCTEIGFVNVRTYINSGNILFESKLSADVLREKLERALQKEWKKSIAVVIRTERELKSSISKNPFPKVEPMKVGVMLFHSPVSKGYLKDFKNNQPEEVVQGAKELYIHYPNGMGRSKLKLPASKEQGTVRNINTLTKLVLLF